jgi:hypothetical protein
MIKSRRMKWAGNVAQMGRSVHVYRRFVGKPERKRTIRRRRRRWVDNIKMDLREIVEWGDMDWTDLARDRDLWRALVKMVMNLRVP